jgi:FK506-binding protein 2
MRSSVLSFLSFAFASSAVAQTPNFTTPIYSVPCNRTTKNGDILTVNYNGTFTNGTLFDASQ